MLGWFVHRLSKWLLSMIVLAFVGAGLFSSSVATEGLGTGAAVAVAPHQCNDTPAQETCQTQPVFAERLREGTFTAELHASRVVFAALSVILPAGHATPPELGPPRSPGRA